MQRAAHRPRPHDRPTGAQQPVDRSAGRRRRRAGGRRGRGDRAARLDGRVGAAGAEREEGGGAVLGLDPDERADDLVRCDRRRAREPLGVEAVSADLGGGQAARSSSRAGSRRETTFETPLPAIDTP
jgi:hypothetical protein